MFGTASMKRTSVTNRNSVKRAVKGQKLIVHRWKSTKESAIVQYPSRKCWVKLPQYHIILDKRSE